MSTDESANPQNEEIAIARKLLEAIMAGCLGAFSELDELYSGLRVGGGFFKGRKMSGEIAKKTRYELIAYISALTRILMETRQNRTSDSDSILRLLEPAVFSFELASARPAYDHYVARYHDQRPTDSVSFPREHVVHSEFIQKLAIDIWSYWSGFNTDESRQYSLVLSEITRKIEAGLRTILNEIWSPMPSSPR